MNSGLSSKRRHRANAQFISIPARGGFMYGGGGEGLITRFFVQSLLLLEAPLPTGIPLSVNTPTLQIYQ